MADIAKEHHGREYTMAGIATAAEYFAGKYSIGWLAWSAALLLCFAAWEYTRVSPPKWRYIWRTLSFAVVIAGTYFVLHQQPPSTAIAQSSPPPSAPSQSVTSTGDNDTTGNINQSGDGSKTAVIGNGNNVNTYNQGHQWSGWLKPGNKPSPKVAACEVPKSMAVYIGGGVATGVGFPMIVLQVETRPLIRLDRNDKGEIAITALIFDDSSPRKKIIAKIDHNKFTVNPNGVFTMESSPDHSSLKVTDNYNVEVLDVEYLNPKAVRVTGILNDDGVRTPIKMTPNDISYNGQTYAGNCSINPMPNRAVYGINAVHADQIPTKQP